MSQIEHEIADDVMTEEQVDEPRLFCVVMHNDNFTTMDFVVMVLLDVFGYTMEKAVAVMMEIHNTGKAVVATLPKEIAEMKIAKVQEYAERAEFPLLVTLEVM